MVRWLTLWSAALLLPAAVALADGIGPQRRPTPAEAQALDELWTAIEQSLPAAPANYTAQFSGPAVSREAFTLPETIPQDQMVRMSFQEIYTLDPSVVQASFANRSQGTPEQQARLAALDAEVGRLSDAGDRTRDRADAKRLRAKMAATEAEADALRETILTEYQRWMASGGMVAAMQEAQKVHASGGLVLRVTVNADAFIPDLAGNIGIPAAMGVRRVFVEEQACNELTDGYCFTVLLGPYAHGDNVNGSRHHTLPGPRPGLLTQARGMVATVGGTKDAGEATDLLKAMDLERLEALLAVEARAPRP